MVEFMAEKEVAIVPSLWLFKDTATKTVRSYWPLSRAVTKSTRQYRVGCSLIQPEKVTLAVNWPKQVFQMLNK